MTLYHLLDQEIRERKKKKIKQPIIFDCDICEPQIALAVITSRWTAITASISHPQRQRGRDRGMFFSLAVVMPNGPSKMCTNQLAWLTLDMVCHLVNLEDKGPRGNVYVCLTVGTGGQMSTRGVWREWWKDVIDGRVEGSIRKSTSGADPWRQKKIQYVSACREENHYYP